jgi:hypothetical protein
MASFDTLLKLMENPDWIAPRSDVRVFLGEPGAPEATKTTVEPGNTFSPGMRSFGVTWWLRFPASETAAFYAPESAPSDILHWRYEEGYLPILHCETEVQGLAVLHSLLQDGTAAEQSEAVCGRLRLANHSAGPLAVQLFLALRSLGPAGGPLHRLAVGSDQRSFWLPDRDLPLLGFDGSPNAIGCGIGDPSADARAGRVPDSREVHDHDGWCFGLARYDVNLAAGESWQVHFDCPQQTYGALHRDLPGTARLRPDQYAARAAAHVTAARARWAHLALDTPDDTFHHAFFAGLNHMLTATVGDQARIAPLSYPLPWLRDSIYLIRCFDLAGLHDLARAATEYCVRNDFFGGFGAEGDAPGQGIWAIVQHYRIMRDRAWLARVFPAVERKCEWLFRMRRAAAPIQVVTDTPILPFMHAQRAAGVICLAAQDGLIQGVMDHGIAYSLGWINHWALCGLHEAAYAAAELGLEENAGRYHEEASALQAALATYSARTPSYFDLERTVNSLLWPTRAWANDLDRVKSGFDSWWDRHRGDGETYRPEPYWLYFELAQAHNALLFGWRERAWQVIQYRLAHQDLPGLYGWREGGAGVGTENAVHGVTLVNQLRGCQRFESITPHGWSQAEMWLLQRAILVEEWQDGLLLFAGVPSDWLVPNASVGFGDFPTWYGKASAQLQVDRHGQNAAITISGIAPGTPVWVRLPGQEVAAVAGHDRLSLSMALHESK